VLDFAQNTVVGSQKINIVVVKIRKSVGWFQTGFAQTAAHGENVAVQGGRNEIRILSTVKNLMKSYRNISITS
jgi:hypothetical protein